MINPPGSMSSQVEGETSFFYKAFFIKKIPPNLYIKVGNKGNCKHELILGGIL
jgi:hypothetical protein